jgi:uncharacterized protein (DUF362 family)
MDDLGLKPQGRTMVKPNTVLAHRLFFRHAFTRPEFLDGLFGAIRERDDEVSDLWLGERCGITIPTRYAFSEAGYRPVMRKHRVKPKFFDEMPQVRRNLYMEGRLRDFIYIPEAVAETDWYISAPKFKAHPWTKVTFNLKLYIGIQDDEHRLIDHDHHLHTKVADLFEVIQPKLCVMDAITAGAKTMLTPAAFPLGLIIISDDAIAADVVCTHIAGLRPEEVDHIRITAERGWGSLSLDDVSIEGDVTLEEAQARAKGFELTLQKADELYNDKTRLKIYLGPPPDTYDYCWGGCPGALTETIGVIKELQPSVESDIQRVHLVYGAYEGEIDAKGKEKVVFVGDCARWQGKIRGRKVDIPYLYKHRSLINPSRVSAGDVVSKILKMWWFRLRNLGRGETRLSGCTVSVAEMVVLMSGYGKTKNPYFDPRIAIRFAYQYVIAKFFRFFGKLRSPSKAALKARSRPKR